MKNILNSTLLMSQRSVLLVALFFACVPADELVAPEVTTSGTLGITANSVNLIGVASGDNITRKGIAYNETGDPNVTDQLEIARPGAGSFTVEITNLEPGTRYFYRAFAQNSAGTKSGSEREFTTGEEQDDPEDPEDSEENDPNPEFLDIVDVDPFAGARDVIRAANIVVEFDESVNLSTTEPGQSMAPVTGQKWNISLADGGRLKMQNQNLRGSHSLDYRFVDMILNKSSNSQY